MLEVERLSVSYGAITAVDELSFGVETGECLALLGPNGAGKSSTLRAISNVEHHGGSVTFAGAPIRRRSPEDLARAGLIHVPEGRHVFPNLTVDENLAMGVCARGGRRPLFGKSDVYALFPALRQIRGRAGWMLSGGEQQMVAIGRAMMASPRLLMLDEPSLGLAPIITRSVFAALGEIMAAGVSLLLVEQATSTALEISDRAIVIVSGSLVLQGTSEDLSDRADLVKAYLR